MSRSVSTVTNEGSDLSLEYDGYGRVAKKVLTREGRTILTVEYTYRNTDANSTTGQIASITIGTNGASRSYTYSYDANGNITSVTEGNNATTYTYDKAGQLLRENNQAAGKTWVWEYDDAGNILNKKEYAYTTGNLGAVLDTVEYQYNNDNWGDLLTSYDGNTITYDEIGNPLNDGTWEYTWEHGRQLSSMTDGTLTLNYEYNADGIRTRKTVSTASDHSHIFQTRVVAPTCTENGYTLHECSCGYSYQSTPVVSTGHTFVASQVEATCTAHGYTLMECQCGYGYQEGTSGHTFTDTVVAPTAEENGYTLHSCECGYSYQDTPVAALGITNSSAGEAANTVVYDYVYNGSSLSYLTVTSTNFGADPVTEELYFGNGTVAYGDDVYYYVTNLQGDVVAIIDADGNPVVQYSYDAWGKILSISGPMADTLGAVNPLTYRGYVYDTETDLYYLESRYYDPAVGRFINADALVSTGQGLLGNNMFVYCNNNPCNRVDSKGYCSYFLFIKIDCENAACPDSRCYNPLARKIAVIYDGRYSGFFGLFHDHGFEHHAGQLIKRLSSTAHVESYSYTTAEEFIDCWNGLTGEYDDVYLVGHGENGKLKFKGELSIAIQDGDYDYSVLQPVNTDTLYLYICNGATTDDYGGSTAQYLHAITGAIVCAVKDGGLNLSWFGGYPELVEDGRWVVVD